MLRLKELRTIKKVSQQKLAIDLGLSQASISKYENGTAEPDINMIIQLSRYFGVGTDYLLGSSELGMLFTKNDLSNEELELLIDYRNLNVIQKCKVNAYVKGISENI